MKAVVLAAGLGSRLKPWTDLQPKVMIPVGGKPPLERHLERLRAAGIEEVFINLHHLPGVITGYFGNGERWGLRLHYAHEAALLGTAGAVKNLEGQLAGEPFLVVYGDNTLEIDYADFLRFGRANDALGIVAVFKKDSSAGSGVVEFGPNGRITNFLEKPESGASLSRWTNAGIYRFGPGLFKHLKPGFSDFGLDVFPLLLKQGESLLAYVFKGSLVAIDTPDLLRSATRRAGKSS